MNVLDRIALKLGMFLTYFAMVIMLVMAVHVSASVIGRRFFGGDIPMTLEITAYYYMICMTFLPLVLVDVQNAHIRADFLSDFLPQRFWAILEVPVMIGMFLYLSFVAWRTAVAAWERMNLGEVLYTAAGDLPIWPSRWILALSLALAAVYSIVQAARAIIALSKGSPPEDGDR